MKIKKITVLCLLAANCLMVSAQKWFTPDVEKQVNILLSQMTVEEKLAYIGGVDWMYTKNIDRLGIHRMKMTDGLKDWVLMVNQRLIPLPSRWLQLGMKT